MVIVLLVTSSRNFSVVGLIKVFFPACLIVLDLAAAIVYGWHGDLRRLVYWVAAAILTVSVTF